jgi:hypothetical protein
LFDRELGRLFNQITTKLSANHDKTVVSGMMCSVKVKDTAVGTNDDDDDPHYDHDTYHLCKTNSDTYRLKRQLFLQNLAFCGWLTENNCNDGEKNGSS